MIHYIYTIVNAVNGKIYVGYTSRKDPAWRWDVHVRDSKILNRPLYNAMRKYGIENFVFDVIYCSLEGDHTLSVMENHFIKEYHSHISEKKGYNITWGGQANTGWVPSEETRALWSKQRKGKVISKETRDKSSLSQKRRYAEHPEHRERLRLIALERGTRPPRSTPETQKKSAEARRGLRYTSEKQLKKLERLSEATKDPSHPFNREGNIEKRKQTWKEIGRGEGAKNGNAVFCNVYDPNGMLVGSGFLRDVCSEMLYPFNKFLAASRHGKPLERGAWRGWRVERINKSAA